MTTNKPEVAVVNEDKMRAEFEAWAGSKKFGLSKGHFKKDEDGEYLNFPTQCYWDVWQASRAAPAVQGEPVGFVNPEFVRRLGVTFEAIVLSSEAGRDRTMPLYATPQPTPEVAMLVEALESIAEYWNQDSNEGAMRDACEYARSAALAALATYRNQGESQ